ncbi:MAG TPA: EamA family transporter [Actinomycetota bacterium]|nr:EamA family transporter [Actinomycetota bacterium]
MSPPRQQTAPSWMVWAALWTVYIVWGSTYLAIRVTVETLPPFLTGGVRFIIAGTLMYVFLLVRRGPKAMRVTFGQLRAAALVGALLLMGGNGLVMQAEQDVPSGLASLIIASTPLWVVLYRYIAREQISSGTLVGVAIGFVGVAVLVLPGDRPDGASLAGIFLLVIAAASWGNGSFLSSRLDMPPDPILSTAYQMLLGGAVSALVGVLLGEASGLEVERFSTSSLLALAYLIVIGSLVAFTAYVWVLQHAPVSKVATYAYVNPVIAIFLGWLILSEEITPAIFVGAAIIVASVAFIVRKEAGSKASDDAVDVPAAGLAGADVSS